MDKSKIGGDSKDTKNGSYLAFGIGEKIDIVDSPPNLGVFFFAAHPDGVPG